MSLHNLGAGGMGEEREMDMKNVYLSKYYQIKGMRKNNETIE